MKSGSYIDSDVRMDARIGGEIPRDLMSVSIQTALGAWRDGTTAISAGRSPQETRARLAELAAGRGLNLVNKKGRLRALKRIGDTLEKQGIYYEAERFDRGYGRAVAHYWTVTPLDLRMHKAMFHMFPHVGMETEFAQIGSLSKHAAARFLQRIDNDTLHSLVVGVFFASVGIDIAKSCGAHFCQDTVPLPLLNMEAIAMSDPRDGTVITFLRVDELGPRRMAWWHKARAFGAEAPDFKARDEEHMAHQRKLTNLLIEGAAIFAETRDHGNRRNAA